MSKFKKIIVLRRDEYLVPMAEDGVHTEINGWTLEQVRTNWFEHYGPDSSHATRDAFRVGNGSKFVSSEIVEEG